MAHARKSVGKAAGADGRMVRLSVPVDVDTHRRLVTLALMTGRTIGEVVVEALAPKLAGVRLGSVGPTVRAEEPAETEPAAPRLAR